MGLLQLHTAAGHYTKIGRLVRVGWLIVVTGVTTQPTGNVIVQNLPFSVSGTSYSNVGTVLYNDVFNNDIGGCYGVSTFIYFAPSGITQSNANFSSVTLSTGYFSGSMTYITA